MDSNSSSITNELVKIHCIGISSNQLVKLLEDEIGECIKLTRTKGRPKTRGLEPAVVTAIIGAGGMALGALFAGLIKIVLQNKSNRITLVGKSGRRIDIPADYTMEKISSLIKHCRELDLDRIVVSYDDHIDI